MGLSKALGVRTEYFFRQGKIELRSLEYRKHPKLLKKVLNQIEGDVIEQIERYLQLEEVLPVSPIKALSLSKSLKVKIESYVQIESLATSHRNAWKLGTNPIPDLIDTFEERGIKVFQSNILHNNQVDGLAAQVNGSPVIVVGKEWPGDR